MVKETKQNKTKTKTKPKQRINTDKNNDCFILEEDLKDEHNDDDDDDKDW